MQQKITNLIIHGEKGEEIPNNWSLKKLLKCVPLTINQKYLTWNCGNNVIRFNLKRVVSWELLPDNTGIIYVHRRKIFGINKSNNAKICNADGSERLTIINTFINSKYYQNDEEFYFAQVWREKKHVLIAVEKVVVYMDTGKSFYLYKAKLDVENGITYDYEPLEEK